MSYIGNEPVISATRTITEVVASGGQTVFYPNGGYTVGYLDVAVNGSILQANDFVATNGTSVTLNVACAASDDVKLIAWGTFTTSTSYTKTEVDNFAVKLTGNQTVAGTKTFSSEISAPNTFGFKNRIINGAMMIDQRNAGAAVNNVAVSTIYTLDRWSCFGFQSSKFSVQQSTDAPAGFTNSLKVTSSSAYSVPSGETYIFSQNIEGYNVSDFGLGAAGASTFTLSFWVKSSLTGSFGASFGNGTNDRTYTFSYTINSANTWEQKTITITGDVTGTWNKTNGAGLNIRFGLGSGSSFSNTANSWASGNFVQPPSTVSVVGTNGATFYITGVQLEKGSTATSFDYRPYGTELALCQRYYQGYTYGVGGRICVGFARSSATVDGIFQFPVMRAAPTVSLPPLGNASGQATYVANSFGYPGMTGTLSTVSVTTSSMDIFQTGDSGFTTGQASVFYTSAGCSMSLSAEL